MSSFIFLQKIKERNKKSLSKKVSEKNQKNRRRHGTHHQSINPRKKKNNSRIAEKIEDDRLSGGKSTENHRQDIETPEETSGSERLSVDSKTV